MTHKSKRDTMCPLQSNILPLAPAKDVLLGKKFCLLATPLNSCGWALEDFQQGSHLDPPRMISIPTLLAFPLLLCVRTDLVPQIPTGGSHHLDPLDCIVSPSRGEIGTRKTIRCSVWNAPSLCNLSQSLNLVISLPSHGSSFLVMG